MSGINIINDIEVDICIHLILSTRTMYQIEAVIPFTHAERLVMRWKCGPLSF